MKLHRLKTWPEYFSEIWAGNKTFEVRKDDREFKIDDRILLCEYNQEKKAFKGRVIRAKVLYKFIGGTMGVESGYCVLSLKVQFMGYDFLTFIEKLENES